MAEGISTRPPKWFWVVSGIALVWNLMGVMVYIMHVTMTDEALAALPDGERLLYETVPAWAMVAFAFAVWGGVLGCVLLLIRKGWALPVFVLSLCGIIVQNIHSFFISKSWEVFGPGSVAMPIMVIVIAIYLVVLSRRARAEGWIG